MSAAERRETMRRDLRNRYFDAERLAREGDVEKARTIFAEVAALAIMHNVGLGEDVEAGLRKHLGMGVGVVLGARRIASAGTALLAHHVIVVVAVVGQLMDLD